MKDSIRNITICGSGLMGSGIAQVFASNEFNIMIYSIEESEVQVKEKVKANLNLLLDNGLGTPEAIENALNRIKVTDDILEATRNADIVFECIPENLLLKQNLFKTLDRLCGPEVILATNTSVISITEIASKSENKERIIGTHFWNPAYLIPLVEVIKAENSSEEVMEATIQLLQKVGKHPIRVNKDVPGFVANRLQHALWREAVSIVENGIADAKTVDESIKYGFGLRLPVLGPMENIDMVGTDLTYSIHNYIFKHLENSEEPSPLLKQKVENNSLGFKTGSGFQEWDELSKEETQKRFIEHLIKITKEYQLN